MHWNPIVGDIASWLMSLGITGTASAVAAWGLFKWLGKKWIEDHFTRELEAFKAEKQAELEKLKTEYGRETERLKADLNRYYDRATRFHNKEYEVLPEAWGLMNKAYGAVSSTLFTLQESPDLDGMEQQHLEEWLENSNLEEHQKKYLISSDNKSQYYMNIQMSKKISEARRATTEFINYIILQGIFIDEPLSQKMMEAGENMQKAIILRRSMSLQIGPEHGTGRHELWEKAHNEIQAVEPVVLAVKQEVRQRLSNIRLASESEYSTI